MNDLQTAAHIALEALIENARLLGGTQAKKGFGCYSQEDANLERAWHEGIAKHSATIRAALAERDEYARANPLGGPATMFDAIARRLRSGEPYDEVLADYGLQHAPAEPVQEPYCYVYEYDSVFGLHREFYPRPYNGTKPSRTVPVYAHPPQRKPLTDEEIADMWVGILYDTPPSGVHDDGLVPHRLARQIELAHGIGVEQ